MALAAATATTVSSTTRTASSWSRASAVLQFDADLREHLSGDLLELNCEDEGRLARTLAAAGTISTAECLVCAASSLPDVSIAAHAEVHVRPCPKRERPPLGALRAAAQAYDSIFLPGLLRTIVCDGFQTQIIVELCRVARDDATLVIVEQLWDEADAATLTATERKRVVRKYGMACVREIGPDGNARRFHTVAHLRALTAPFFEEIAVRVGSARAGDAEARCVCYIARKRNGAAPRRAPQRVLRRVCVFSSVRVSTPAFKSAAKELGAAMATRRIDLLHGGGTTGLMGCVARSVLKGGGSVLGVIPDALRAVSAKGPPLGETRFVADFAERKRILYPQADAFVALPGGIGTLAELLEVLCEHQLGARAAPIGVINVEGAFDPLLTMLEHGVKSGLVKPIYLHILQVATNAEDLLNKLAAYVPPLPFSSQAQWARAAMRREGGSVDIESADNAAGWWRRRVLGVAVTLALGVVCWTN